jgi:hypothetical protein
VLKPVLTPFDDPVVAFPVVPVPVELPTLPEPAGPAAAAPLVPAPVPSHGATGLREKPWMKQLQELKRELLS